MDLYHILQLVTDEKVRHKWYDRTVKLADEYFRFVTGEGIETLLKIFVRRESEDEFEQRKIITQQITPAWSNKINKGFIKVHRADNINRVIKFSKEEKTNKLKLQLLISKYRADKPLKDYLIKAFDRYNMIDPNAFLVNTFVETEDQSQPNQPVAIEFISKNVLNYQYENDILQWIVFRDFILVKNGKEIESIARYQLLAPDIRIEMKPVPNDTANDRQTSKEITEDAEFFRLDDQLYQLTTTETGLETIPAIPFGYKEDFATNGDTFVSVWHEAMPYYWKSLKVVSEFDLTAALIAFPQKRQYVGSCNAEGCNNGMVNQGMDTCSVCKGEGLAPISTTAQDAVTYKMPPDGEPVPDISNYVVYDSPDVGTVKWQEEYIDKLEAKAIGAIFNSEMFVKTTTVETATKTNSEKDNINDPLLGYAEGFSEKWKFVVRSVAEQANISTDELTLTYEFPKDFKFETLDQIIETFKKAVDTNAPADVRGAIARRLAEKAFVDDPMGLLDFEAKQKLQPFPNESRENVERKIALGLVLSVTEFIWANFEDLIALILIDDPLFFSKNIKDQKETLKAKAEELDTRSAGAMNITEG